MSQECEEAKTSVLIISSSFQSIWMEFGNVLRLVVLMKLILVSSCPDRLVGLVVKVSASRANDPGFKSRLRRDFSGVESYK